MQTYIEVILPLSLANTYTYLLPEEMSGDVKVGVRVIVPFGKTKFYTALVYNIHFNKPENIELKEVITVLDQDPVVTLSQIKFWEWIAKYYQCTLGEVFKAALPSGLKLESETVISLVDDFVAEAPLKDREQQLLDLLSKKDKTISELNKEMKLKNVLPLVKRMMEMGAVAISEEVKGKYKPKMDTYVRLSSEYADSSKMASLFDSMSRAKKQLDLLMTYLQLSLFMQKGETKEVSKKELLSKNGISVQILTSLVEKGIMELYTKEVDRINTGYENVQISSSLSEIQQTAFDEVVNAFSTKQTVLLHGVTSSGKTEIYIHLIEDAIRQGKQVLFLLPEIALTTQITNRLKRVFGDKLGVYHSKFSDTERIEIWKNLLEDKGIKVILGVRSSIFLPFKKLGLVIVDEEHENTYKQYDPAPRYHARNAAIVLASFSGAKVLLGSATPSLDTYANASSGKYGLVELLQRYEGIQMPEIIVSDVKEARRKKEMNGNFSPLLRQQMAKAFERKEQVILFQNRRGFAPFMECRSCACVPKCVNCDISLTYHKSLHQLTCHYCGYTIPVPVVCPACGNPTLEPKGFGTEKIEEEVAEIFPNVSVARLDLDVAKSRKSYERIISEFEKGKIDVLVGTQMISKGLDFERVRLVGILSADSLLNYPDFRSYERAFQMMAQVSGRAGRKNNRGIVVLQTTTPDHPIIKMVCENNYLGMYDSQMHERNLFKYPPYYRLIYLFIKGRDYSVVASAAQYMAKSMRQVFGDRVYGPDKPLITRLQSLFIQKIMLKIEQNASSDRAKELLREIINQTLSQECFKSTFVQVDVDPM